MHTIVYGFPLQEFAHYGVKKNTALLKHIASRIKEERKRKEMSQELLAERADCHRNYIARCEAGLIDISVSGLYQLAKGLALDPCDLLKK